MLQRWYSGSYDLYRSIVIKGLLPFYVLASNFVVLEQNLYEVGFPSLEWNLPQTSLCLGHWAFCVKVHQIWSIIKPWKNSYDKESIMMKLHSFTSLPSRYLWNPRQYAGCTLSSAVPYPLSSFLSIKSSALNTKSIAI